MDEILNLPEYAWTRHWVVAKNVNGDIYFWGAWNEITKAMQAAEDIGGIVIENTRH